MYFIEFIWNSDRRQSVENYNSYTQTTVTCANTAWNNTFRTLAGTGSAGSTSTTLYYPYGAAFDSSGTLYVADRYNHRIQRFVGGSTTASTVSGLSLYYPADVKVDSANNLYILDTYNFRILRWSSGTVTVVAGGHGNGGAYSQINYSYAMLLDSSANIYISDCDNDRVMLWYAGNTVAGVLVAGGYGRGNAPQQFSCSVGMSVDTNGIMYITDYYNHRVQQWNPGAAIGITVAGRTSVSGPWAYTLTYPVSVIHDQYNYLYILDAGNSRIQRWVPGADYGYTVVAATISTPRGLFLDVNGNMVVTDQDYHRIVSFAMYCPPVTTTTTTTQIPQITVPVCSTAAWNSTFAVLAGSSGNAGSSAILLRYPRSSFIDIYGNLYVADSYNHRIQYFQRGSTTATTVAGITSNAGSSYSQLTYPSSIYVDVNRIMYILDTDNCRVLQWTPGDPLGYPVAGDHGCGSALTQIDTSYSMFVDNQYNIYISDSDNHRVTLWTPTNTSSGILVAGGYGAGSTSEKLYNPWGVYVDSNQTIYVVDRTNHRVQMWYSEALAGITVAGATGSAGPFSYQLSSPTSITLDPYGYIYVLDYGNNRVQKWYPGAAYGATVITGSLNAPCGLQFDRVGNIVISDTSNHRILSYAMTCPATTTTTATPPTTTQSSLCPTSQWNQTLSVLAGVAGSAGTSTTLLNYPYSIDFDGYENLYVADTANHRIQFYPHGTSIGTTVAGSSGTYGGTYAQLYNPYAIYVDSNRAMYILDTSNYRVLIWQFGEPRGYVVAGGNGAGAALTQITTSYAMFVDDQSNVYVSESGNHRVTLWLSTNTTAGILVAGGNGAGSTPERLYNPWGIYVDSNQTVYIVDRTNHRVQLWLNGAISGTTVAGTTGDAGPWSYQLSSPTSLLLDQYGYLYILDYGNARIQKWFPGAPYGATVVSASFYNPCGMQFDLLNNLVVADTYHHQILSFGVFCPATTTTTTTASPATTSSTPICATAQWNQTFSILAGITGSRGTTPTLLYNPCGAVLDGYQNLYVADTTNHRIQYFPRGTLTGITVAGSSGSYGSTYAQLYNPHAIYVDSNRVMYILDTTNYRVLRWQFGDPFGHVVAGGNGAGAALTQITTSYALFVDSQSNVYVSEYSNHRVTLWLSINTTSGILVAGGNGAGSTSERLDNPWGIYVDVNGSMYICDTSNHRVQLWQSAISGVTVAGTTGISGPYAYQLNTPTGVTVDPYGNIYVLDTVNSRVQKWHPGATYGITMIAVPMNTPYGLHADNQGNLIVADTYNYRILSFPMTCPGTTTTTMAPTFQTTVPVCSTAVWNQTYSTLVGSLGAYGSTATTLYNPSSIGFDRYGYMYIADISNHRIQRYPPGSNIGTTVAGVTSAWGSSRGQLYNPYGLHVTANGTMFILDTSNYRVFKWQLGEPMGYIVAGGNGNGAAYTQIGVSYAMFVDDQYSVYVSESSNNRITQWSMNNATSGALIAGGNGAGSTADKLSSPYGIFVTSNSIYIVDQGNHRVQKWNFVSILGASLATTVAGSTSDPGPWAYQFNTPTSITLDPYSYIYVLDSNNDRVQKWYPGALYGTTVASTAMASPLAMQFDPVGNLVISDTGYHRTISFNIMCPSPTTTTTLPPSQSFSFLLG
ncbi:unnamed protein product [Rotaria sp. Silwood2]|nr:unnamed protein product [Rotaria sp. Silwood2]